MIHMIFLLSITRFLTPSLEIDEKHAIYVSVIEISENEEHSNVEIKIFSDDLQNAIKNYSPEYRPGSLSTFADLNKPLIHNYFNRHLSMDINQNHLPVRLESWKIENDAHFLRFTFRKVSEWKQVKIEADFLMELFPDQSNIVSIRYGGERYLDRLTASKRETILKISR